VRKIDLGLDFVGFPRGTSAPGDGARGCLGCGAEMSPHLFRLVILERAGMGFLLGDTYLRQHIENGLALDFKFPGQVVDPNLTHQLLLAPHRS